MFPGYTDNEKDLLALKKFLSELKTIKRIDLLPYHSLGKYKWENLGLKYQLDGTPDATQEDINRVKKILEIE